MFQSAGAAVLFSKGSNLICLSKIHAGDPPVVLSTNDFLTNSSGPMSQVNDINRRWWALLEREKI